MEILFYDHDLAVCVKPVGLDSEAQVPAELKKTLGGEIFPVHRLDKNVGGVMVYARTKQAAAALSKAVQDGAMVKEYVAMVHGLPPESGDWEDLLWKDSRKNKVYVVKRERSGVKKARLEFTRLSALGQTEKGYGNPPGSAVSSAFACIRGGATRSGYSLPPEGIRWWATTNTVPGMSAQTRCCFPAASASRGAGNSAGLKLCRISGKIRNTEAPPMGHPSAAQRIMREYIYSAIFPKSSGSQRTRSGIPSQ